MGIEKYVNNIRSKISISGLLIVLGIAGFFGYDKYSEHTKKNNLEGNAFWCGGNQFEEQYGKAFLKNKDLDGNGKYETVIKWVGKDGKYHELEIIMNENHQPEILYPKRE